MCKRSAVPVAGNSQSKEMEMISVYVAGPYSKPSPLKNVHNAIEAAEELLKYGFQVYVPHLTHYWEMYHYQHPYEWWLEFDKVWLGKCNCMLRLPGESGGSDKEEEYAKEIGIPVFFTIQELKDYYKVQYFN
jgi:hypothetical protein